MTLSRRSLLGGILALGVAPEIVRASSLMPVKSHNLMCDWDKVAEEIGCIDPDVWAWNSSRYWNRWGELPTASQKAWAAKLHVEVMRQTYFADRKFADGTQWGNA